MLTQLRKPRYLRLAALMLLVATICVAAGTWQIQRLIEKHDANVLLRSNAEGPAAPVHDVLATTATSTTTTPTATTPTATTPTATPASAAAPAQSHHAQFRTVTATGVYVAGAQELVREQTVDDTVGYLVLTPLRTVATAGSAGADLLIVRGFLPAQGDQTPTPAAPPTGSVTVRARVQPADTADDEFGRVPGQVRRINAAQMAARLHTPVYAAYAELLARQPGTAGLTVIPDPDLSNAAGGAIEPQHIAYIIQWYLFALIALAAPLVMARSDAQRDGEAPARAGAKSDPWAALDDDGALLPTTAAGEQDLPSQTFERQQWLRATDVRVTSDP